MDFFVEPAFFVLCIPIVGIAVVLGILERPLARYGFVASVAMLLLLFCRSLPALVFFCAYLAGSLLLFLWVRCSRVTTLTR